MSFVCDCHSERERGVLGVARGLIPRLDNMHGAWRRLIPALYHVRGRLLAGMTDCALDVGVFAAGYSYNDGLVLKKLTQPSSPTRLY